MRLGVDHDEAFDIDNPELVGADIDIAPGHHLNVSVTFDPRVTGPAAATLVIVSTDPDFPRVELPLTGTGF